MEDNWETYQRLVLDKLRDHDKKLESINNTLGTVHTDLATLKVRAGIWGALAGSIPGLILLGLKYLP